MTVPRDLQELAASLGPPTAEHSMNLATFPIPTRQGSLSDAKHDLLNRCRVIAGAPGSGKTAVARLVMDEASRKPMNMVVQGHAVPPDSTTLAELASTFGKPGRPDMWRKLWRSAILCSIASVHYAPIAGQDLPAATALGDSVNNLPFRISTRASWMHPFHAVRELLDAGRRTPDVLDLPVWDELEHNLSSNVTHQVVVLLDDLDHVIDNAPHLHYESMAGLVTEVLRHANQPLGQIARVVVVVQQSVLSLLAPNALRDSTALLEISWDTRSLEDLVARTLFHSSAAELPERLNEVLGVAQVANRSRGGVPEPLVGYLLRHTRGTPREIATLIRPILLTLAPDSTPERVEVVIRDRVAAEAYEIGEQALYHVTTTCAALFPDIVMGESTAGLTRRPFEDKLRAFLRALGAETATKSECLEVAYVAFDEPLATIVLRQLWFARLLGEARSDDSATGSPPIFRFTGHSRDPGLAQYHVESIAMNSCLLEVVGQLEIHEIPPICQFE